MGDWSEHRTRGSDLEVPGRLSHDAGAPAREAAPHPARTDLGAFDAPREALAKIVTSETDETVAREAAVAAVGAHYAIARTLPP